MNANPISQDRRGRSWQQPRIVGHPEVAMRLLLIILWAVAIIVVGFYSGLALHHHWH